MENELCEQLIRICANVGLDPDHFDGDESQFYCMIQMATAIADKQEGKPNKDV